jgi:hypothetical protein
MASILQDLNIFARPFIPHDFTLSFGVGEKKVVKKISMMLRMPSAEEADVIDAFQSDRYSEQMEVLTKSVPGKMSEYERMLKLYQTRPKSDLVNQFLPTVQDEIDARAVRASGINMDENRLAMIAMTPEERIAHAREQEQLLKPYQDTAKEEMRAEVDADQDKQTLVEQLAYLNVNIKAQVFARRAAACTYLQGVCYKPTPDGSDPVAKAWDSVDQVRKELQAEVLDVWFTEAKKAIDDSTTVPFEWQDAKASEKPSSSPSNSEPESKDSGPPTEETKAN